MFARFLAVALMVLACSTPALAQDDNLQVFRDVQRQVLRYTHFTIFDDVNAQIDGGVVTLTGKVTMPYKRSDIERRVSRVSGVREVHNRIEVLPVSQFDDELRVSIARAIYRNPSLTMYATQVNPPIHVIVDHGRVTITGVVNNELDRMLVRSIASSFPAFEFKNELKTDAEAKAELERL
jgi:hyperosmotically inducible protein